MKPRGKYCDSTGADFTKIFYFYNVLPHWYAKRLLNNPFIKATERRSLSKMLKIKPISIKKRKWKKNTLKWYFIKKSFKSKVLYNPKIIKKDVLKPIEQKLNTPIFNAQNEIVEVIPLRPKLSRSATKKLNWEFFRQKNLYLQSRQNLRRTTVD